MLPYKSHSQGMEEHAFADDGDVGDTDAANVFTERERIDLEDGVEDGGYGDGSGDGDEKPEVFFRGGIVPEDGVGARDDDDHEERYDEKCCFQEIKVVSGDDEGGGAGGDIPYGIENVEEKAETRFLVVFIDNFRRMPQFDIRITEYADGEACENDDEGQPPQSGGDEKDADAETGHDNCQQVDVGDGFLLVFVIERKQAMMEVVSIRFA